MKQLWYAGKEYYNSRFRSFASRENLLQWQQRALESHLKWVCENSPYYKDCRDLPLQDFPLMDKNSMMDNFNCINTVGLNRDKLFEIALAAENNRQFDNSELNGITVGMSSGTSGRRGLFLVSKEEQARWAGYIVGRLMPSIVKPQRIALLLRANSNLYRSVGKAHFRFQYIDLCQPVESWLEDLQAFNPTIVVGSAQSLVVASEQGRRLKPDLVVSGAEVLTPEDKQMLIDGFNCEVKEVYQCTEGFLASTHRDGRMRWNEDLVHIERHWIDASKTYFQPVVTDFRRKSQPVIRYLMDDVILPFDDNGVFSGIEKITGRSGDILQIGGIKVLPDLVYNAVCRSVGERVNFVITQVKPNVVVINSDHSASAIEKALRDLFAALGISASYPLQITHAGSPALDLSVKHRRVINQCRPDEIMDVSSAA